MVAAICSLCRAKYSAKAVNAVMFERFGTFDLQGLRAMRALSDAATIKDEVEEEEQ